MTHEPRGDDTPARHEPAGQRGRPSVPAPDIDRELRAYAREASPSVPPTLVDSAFERVARQPHPTPARSLVHALRHRSLSDAVASYRAALRAAFGPDVPLAVRLQSFALAVGVALFLAVGTTFGAAGASEIARLFGPTPTPIPEHTFAPSPSASIGPSASTTAGAVVHIVEEGETLADIAARYGVSVDALARENEILTADLVRVGQRLRIPDPAVPTTTEPAEASPPAAPSVSVPASLPAELP